MEAHTENPTHDVDDDQDPALFRPQEWINRGKVYSNAPLFVMNERYRVIEVPSFVEEKLPSLSLSIPEMTEAKLPRSTSMFAMYPTDRWFSNEPPMSYTPDQLWNNFLVGRSIPSRKILQNLDESFGQRWLNGAQSIIDARYNKGADRLPLYMLGIWSKIRSFLDIQEELQSSYLSVTQAMISTRISNKFIDVTSFFAGLRWGGEVAMDDSGFRKVSRVHEYVCLLQDRMLPPIVTEAMVAQLRRRLEDDPAKRGAHYIAASIFYALFDKDINDDRLSGRRKFASFAAIEEKVKKNPNLCVWFPVLHNQHEVTVCIDFGASTISYGEHI